jgi:hypothetical protein
MLLPFNNFHHPETEKHMRPHIIDMLTDAPGRRSIGSLVQHPGSLANAFFVGLLPCEVGLYPMVTVEPRKHDTNIFP